jgi:AcrR family transcriptional regulator
MGMSIPNRGGSADRIADNDRALDLHDVQELLEQLCVAPRTGRHAVAVRAPLPRPIQCEYAIAIAQTRRQPREIAGAVADRVQADDRGARAVVVVGEANAVNFNFADGRHCAGRAARTPRGSDSGCRARGRGDRQPCGCVIHSDKNITMHKREATGLGFAPRPRRGTPAQTRKRLIDAAAAVFNRDGYDGTDSNRLARAAGYAPATFYKHFADKREIFLAAYEHWVSSEWSQVERIAQRPQSSAQTAAQIVALTLAHHRRWRGLRASLRALVATDRAARVFYRAQRRRQLRLMKQLRGTGARAGRGQPEKDALLLFTLERVCDAIAEGEVRELGLSTQTAIRLLRELVARHLAGASTEV